MITQKDVDTYANIIKWGCLVPIAVGVLLLLLSHIFSPYIDMSNHGFVPELGLHYKIKYYPYTPEKGRRIYKARLYFSRTDTFETDYIDFLYTEVNYPRIYYVEPDTFYIFDRDSFYIQDISNKEFAFEYVNRKSGSRDYKKYEHEDSLLDAKSYSIDLYGFAKIVTVFDQQGEIIYQKSFKLF